MVRQVSKAFLLLLPRKLVGGGNKKRERERARKKNERMAKREREVEGQAGGV